MTQNPIKVMLVDDHAVVRMGFRLLLEGVADIRVLAEAESGEEAVRTFAEVKPDVVVMDISMPGIGGLEAIDRILAREPQARILVLSAFLPAAVLGLRLLDRSSRSRTDARGAVGAASNGRSRLQGR